MDNNLDNKIDIKITPRYLDNSKITQQSSDILNQNIKKLTPRVNNMIDDVKSILTIENKK